MKFLILAALCAASASGQTPLQSGIQLFDAGQFVQSERFFGDVVKREPANHTAMYYLARSIAELDEARLERMPETRSWLEKAIKLEPANSNYHLWYGHALGTQALNSSRLKMIGLAGKIRHEFETAVKLDPANVDARIALMEYYLNAPGIAGGSKTKAKQQAEAARTVNAYRGALAAARVHAASSSWSAAEQELRAIGRSHPDSTEVGVELAVMYQDAKQYERAFATVDSLQRGQPNEAIWLYQLGRTASVSGEQHERGAQALLAYLAIPEDRRRTAHAYAHYRLGLVYEKQDQKDLARQEYRAALARQPHHKEAKKGLSRVGK